MSYVPANLEDLFGIRYLRDDIEFQVDPPEATYAKLSKLTLSFGRNTLPAECALPEFQEVYERLRERGKPVIFRGRLKVNALGERKFRILELPYEAFKK